MNVIYDKQTGDVIDYVEGDVKGLNPDYAVMAYEGDKTQTNISEIDDSKQLESMTELTKLEIRRALRALGEEAKLDAILQSSQEFASDWADSIGIDMADPMVTLALESADIDVDAVKRKILTT